MEKLPPSTSQQLKALAEQLLDFAMTNSEINNYQLDVEFKAPVQEFRLGVDDIWPFKVATGEKFISITLHRPADSPLDIMKRAVEIQKSINRFDGNALDKR